MLKRYQTNIYVVEEVNNIVSSNNNHQPKVVVIFPTLNEEKTIKQCIEEVKKSKYKPMVIVSDGNSTDRTREIAREAGAIVTIQDIHIHPGKGAGMITGVKKAFEYEPDIIVFLDADITNLTYEWADQLVEPIVAEGYDMTRGWYIRAAGDAPVTKLVVKPLLWAFFPELWHYEQPLSGEIAGKVGLWKSLLNSNPPKGWGIDIWILIEATILGYNIKEVFLGIKSHRSYLRYSQDVSNLAKMSEQVAFAIIQEAMKYKRLDNATRIAV